MNITNRKLFFASDYMEGAHPNIIKRLVDTNLVKSTGYGTDEFSESAKERIRKACSCPEAEIYFLVGGTQTNATVIDALLPIYQGVIAPDTGHISLHEAGAIEASGHKVLVLPHTLGKISARQIEKMMKEYEDDRNHEHMVMPGMVYLSQPTEYGTLYTLQELQEISQVCRKNKIPLYLDGARLAYGLACPQNDVTLKDIAKLCDVFYIGGTKCGALFGEAVVIPQKGRIPGFFTIIKQHGALMAKGRLLGLQFEELFTKDLYEHIGESAIVFANEIREAWKQCGYRLYFENPTNQVFCVVENSKLPKLAERVEFGFWEKCEESHTIIRLATSWATTESDVKELIRFLSTL
jgi:threonine aldolase